MDENALIEYLRGTDNALLQNLNETSLKEITKKDDIDSFNTLMKNYSIWVNHFEIVEYRTNILELVCGKGSVRIFRFLTTTAQFLAIMGLIITSILLSNYWLLLTIVLVFFSSVAATISPTILTGLFRVSSFILLIYGVYSKIDSIIYPTIILLTLHYLIIQGKKFFRKSIRNAASESELKFKLLFVSWQVFLHDFKKNETIKYDG